MKLKANQLSPQLFAHNVIGSVLDTEKIEVKYNTYLLGFLSGSITLQRTNRLRGGCFEAWETPGYVEIDMGYEMQRHGHLYKIQRFKDSKTWHPSQA